MATCRNCPYYFILNHECRRNPPIGVPIPQGSDLKVFHYWPPSREDQWCGEHPSRKGAPAIAEVSS